MSLLVLHAGFRVDPIGNAKEFVEMKELSIEVPIGSNRNQALVATFPTLPPDLIVSRGGCRKRVREGQIGADRALFCCR